MENKKVTAIEWFFDKLKNHEIQAEHFELYQQAKEMEKEQMIDFVKNMPMEIGNDDEGNSFVRFNPLEYYNQTYTNGL
jgi:hypothetical protein